MLPHCVGGLEGQLHGQTPVLGELTSLHPSAPDPFGMQELHACSEGKGGSLKTLTESRGHSNLRCYLA